jgi:APA family basic amino acid/polyamine antiporter
MTTALKKELSVFDSTSIIVGIIIGAGIYETAPTVAACMVSPTGTLTIWLVGGLLALTGALCYAELATTYPRQGGDYVYLTNAYGKGTGFLFGWSQLAVVRPADITLMAFIFARYAKQLYSFNYCIITYAAAAIIILTLINALGIKESKWTQNILTVIKTAGLLAVITAGLISPGPQQSLQTQSSQSAGLNLALILVLFTFGGWNEMAYVAAEVKNPNRNIVRALVTGTCAVTILYLLANWAFLHTLGYEKMTSSQAVAADTVSSILPNIAAKAISILICISTLGAINGLIFTGSRISYAIGTEHSLFKVLGKWNSKRSTPVRAIFLQGLISLIIALAAGSFIDTIVYTAPVVWLFFLATGISLFVLRRKDPRTPRPYKITAFPLTPIIFCASCIFMLYNSISYALSQKPVAFRILVSVVVAGLFIYLLFGSRKKQPTPVD